MAFNVVFGSGVRRLVAVIVGLLICAPSAFAQAVATQFLVVAFTPLASGVPLSDWLTAGTALVLAATAVVLLRARGGRGGRLLGTLLAVVTGAVLVAATGERLISEVRAGADPQEINLVVSPGSLELVQYVPSVMQFLQIVVTNTTAVDVQISSIGLNPGNPFQFASPGTNACFVGEQLAPGGSCIVYLELLNPV